MPFGITLFADFYCRIVIAAGNTGLSGKGAVIAAPQYHKKERSSVAVQAAACFLGSLSECGWFRAVVLFSPCASVVRQTVPRRTPL